ncbi:MAG: hypothetical protein RDV48_16385 [Candidatus Eremiobacteraeota bacterium]|nr:hypothetical protein [Candidatus Eremiobacteraeota bacterium]
MMKLLYYKCFDCDNRWIDFTGKGKETRCGLCGKPHISEPVFISKIRRTLEVLNEEVRNLEIAPHTGRSRSTVLYDMYLEVAPVILERSHRIFSIAIDEICEGQYSSDVMSRLTLSLVALADLGFSIPSALMAHILSLSLVLRNHDNRFQRSNDEFQQISQVLEYSLLSKNLMTFHMIIKLLDFYRAMEWNGLTLLKEWLAAIHLMNYQNLMKEQKSSPDDSGQGKLNLACYHLMEARRLINEWEHQQLHKKIQRKIHEINEALEQQKGEPMEGRNINEPGGLIDTLKIDKRIEVIGKLISDGIERGTYQLVGDNACSEGSLQFIEKLIFMGPSILNEEQKREILWGSRFFPESVIHFATATCQFILDKKALSTQLLLEHLKKTSKAVKTLLGKSIEWLNEVGKDDIELLNSFIVWGPDEILIREFQREDKDRGTCQEIKEAEE